MKIVNCGFLQTPGGECHGLHLIFFPFMQLSLVTFLVRTMYLLCCYDSYYKNDFERLLF